MTTFFTVIFALVHAVALVAIAVWFVYEQWRFRRQSGPIGRKLTESSVMMSALAWFMKIWQLQILGASRQISSSFPRQLPRWWLYRRESSPSPGDTGRSVPKEVTESDLEVVIEAPSRPESVMSIAVPIRHELGFRGRRDQSYHEDRVTEGEQTHHQESPVDFPEYVSEEDRWTARPSDSR